MKNVLEAIKFFKNKNFEDITPSGYSNIFTFMQRYDEKKAFVIESVFYIMAKYLYHKYLYLL